MADVNAFQKYGMIVILCIVGFTLLAALYPEASSAGDSLNATNDCVNRGCYYNTSGLFDEDCYTNSNSNVTCASGGGNSGLPLGGLFASGGVLFIVISAVVLLYYLKKSR